MHIKLYYVSFIIMKTIVEKRWQLWQKIVLISLAGLFSFLLLIFLTIWVVFPLVFMNSISVQTYFMFMNIQVPKNPDFNSPEKYGIGGVINVYITTKNTDNSSLVSIGAWTILPETEKNTTNYNTPNGSIGGITAILRKTAYPILVYLHGVACNRISPLPKYEMMRKYFMVIAVDHRGYGDSGPDLQPTELGIARDTAQIYEWIRSLTKNDIFIWGHSLGAALGTHAVKILKRDYGTVPMGLILESAFTTMREEVASSTIGKLFKWLLYFEQTIQRPLEQNGFIFNTSHNILSVNCPIMIMHAEDDNVIPYFMGKKVGPDMITGEIAQMQRDVSTVGNVTYHQMSASSGYKHNDIINDPRIPEYIKTFMTQCREQNKGTG